MDIKLRAFEFGDMPKLSKILRKMDLKDDLKRLFSVPSIKSGDTEPEKAAKSRKAEETGAEFAATAISNVYQAEIEIYEFIAGLSGLTVDQVKKLGIEDLKNMFIEFGKNAGGLVSFFKSAAK